MLQNTWLADTWVCDYSVCAGHLWESTAVQGGGTREQRWVRRSERVIRTEDREGERDREVANFDPCLLIWVTRRVADFTYYCLNTDPWISQMLLVQQQARCAPTVLRRVFWYGLSKSWRETVLQERKNVGLLYNKAWCLFLVPGRRTLSPWNLQNDSSVFVILGGPLRPLLTLCY